MVPIRIQCGCGQLYEFEVEPVDGRMPSAVACPVCGADGTDAANAAIAQGMTPQRAAAPATGQRLRVSLPARSDQTATSITSSRTPERHGALRLPGQTDRTQAKIEARAKVSWGESPREVLVYLMSQGFHREEASDLVDEMFRERNLAIRGKGIMYIFGGIALVCVPIGAFITFMVLGYIYVKTFLVTIIVGFGGVWLVIKGIGMLIAPKSAKGDVTEQ